MTEHKTEFDQQVETVTEVISRHFTNRSNGGQFTYLTADDFRASPRSIALAVVTELNSPSGVTP